MQRKKILIFFVSFLALAHLLARDEDLWNSGLEKVPAVVSLIENNYYEEVDQEKLTFSSIRGALETLDPHSYFLDPNNFSRMREEYVGKYYGLGIQISKQEDRLVVISPIEGTPAYRLGIRPGDVISHINGESTKPLSSFEAMQKLRGPKGTKVNITIVREGLEKPMDLTIVREEIPLYSVPYAFMLNKDTGYIFIRNFAETTVDEFEDKIAGLLEQGLKSLVLDLRGNSGGPFFQSVDLADEFLPKDALIVSIRGRNTIYNKEVRASRNRQYEKIPLVVLIDQGSASASEIVAGAVMDNDRGLIVGRDSWGKGLVQTIFPLSANMAVAITTAKYYTPSGRSIQRDYSHLDDWLLNKEAPEEKREVKYTSKGRKVLGQGGIAPDYQVDTSLKLFTANLLIKGVFFSYGRKFSQHQTDLSQKFIFPQEQSGTAGGGQGTKILGKDLVVNGEVLEDFKAYLRASKIEFDPEKFQDAEAEIKRELQREIVSAFWGVEEGFKAARKEDPVILKALDVMPEASKFIEE